MEQVKKLMTGTNLPRLIITMFFLLIVLVAVVIGMPLGSLMSDTLIRFGMNGIMVLAMVPAIQSGIGPNFGLPIGIIAGLMGALISFQLNLLGVTGFLAANLIAIPIAIVVGVLFGIMLNRIKGSEMIVSTYTGFSVVSLMSIAWILLPFSNAEMVWPIGSGLRNVITLETYYGKILDDFLSIKFVTLTDGTNLTMFNKTTQFLRDTYGSDYAINFQLPTGLILFFFLLCFFVYLFINSKTGVALRASGDNPGFAKASGIDVDKARIVGTTLSTVLGAVGIIAYSQSYGFLQLYQAPLMMAFPAVAAILIGGASASNAKISHVIIGTFLFNGLLTISLPVANQILPEGNLSEVIRMIVQNGVILYALTKVGGDE